MVCLPVRNMKERYPRVIFDRADIYRLLMKKRKEAEIYHSRHLKETMIDGKWRNNGYPSGGRENLY